MLHLLKICTGVANRGANVAFTLFAPHLLQFWTRFAHIFTAQIWCKSVFSFSEFKVSQDKRLLSLLARIGCSSRYINYTFSLLNFFRTPSESGDEPRKAGLHPRETRFQNDGD